MCILGGIAVSSTLNSYVGNMELFGSSSEKAKGKTADSSSATTGSTKTGTKGGKQREEKDNYPYKQEVILV